MKVCIYASPYRHGTTWLEKTLTRIAPDARVLKEYTFSRVKAELTRDREAPIEEFHIAGYKVCREHQIERLTELLGERPPVLHIGRHPQDYLASAYSHFTFDITRQDPAAGMFVESNYTIWHAKLLDLDGDYMFMKIEDLWADHTKWADIAEFFGVEFAEPIDDGTYYEKVNTSDVGYDQCGNKLEIPKPTNDMIAVARKMGYDI